MIAAAWSKQYPEDTLIISETRVVNSNHAFLSQEILEADRVVCTVGRTSGYDKSTGEYINTIDYLEKNLSENLRDNLYAPMMLGMLCKQLQKHMVYLGTGCIFSWDTNKNVIRRVTEHDYPDFFGSGYSTVKGNTDDLMRQLDDTVCNCRIRMPIINADHPKNFITKIVGYKKINDMYNSMTYLPQIIPVIIEMSRSQTTGTWNMTNPGYTNHSSILRLYSTIINPKHSYVLAAHEELGLISARSNNILDTTKLERYCADKGLRLTPIVDAIQECFDTYNRAHNQA